MINPVRNSSTLGLPELDIQPPYRFSSENECEYMFDPSMLALYPAFQGWSSVICSFMLLHFCFPPLEVRDLKSPCLPYHPPCICISSSKNPLSCRIPRSHLWYRYWIFSGTTSHFPEGGGSIEGWQACIVSGPK